MPPAAAYEPVELLQATAEAKDVRLPPPGARSSARTFWSVETFTFGWLTPLLKFGKTTPLEQEHLPPLADRHQADRWVAIFDAAWQRQRAAASSVPSSPGGAKAPGAAVGWALLHTLRCEIVTVVFLCFIMSAFQFGRVFALKALIQHLEVAVESSLAWGLALAGVLMGTTLFHTFVWQQIYVRLEYMALHTRVALQGALFNKLLRLNAGTSKGSVVMLCSTDVNRLQSLVFSVSSIVRAPTTILFTLGIAFYFLGYAGIAVVAAASILGPAAWYTTGRFDAIQDALTRYQQQRLRVLTESLQGVAVVKFFGWEKVVKHRITQIRDKELQQVRKHNFGIAFIMSMFWMYGPVLSAAGFTMYALLGHAVTASTIFPILFILAEMEWAVLWLPDHVAKLSAARTSVTRLADFLSRPEIQRPIMDGSVDAHVAVSLHGATLAHAVVPAFIDEDVEGAPDPSEEGRPPSGSGAGSGPSGVDYRPVGDDGDGDEDDGTVLLPMSSATVSDGASAAIVAVRDLTLNVPTGQLLAVVGRVGAGKSSMLAGLLGELQVMSGSVGVRGSVAYVTQEPWVRSATIRDNILCGAPFDADKYARTIEACALLRDLEGLEARDFTEVGERGITLSGGQRARLSLARAVYRDADVYLLDDPLSAVDAHVGRWLFERCVGNSGVLAGKTRVLVTHQLQWLPQAEAVAVLSGGRLVHHGTYEELIDAGVTFESLMCTSSEEDTERGDDATGEGTSTSGSEALPAGSVPPEEGIESKLGAGEVKEVTTVTASELVCGEAEARRRGKVVTEEDRERGTVGWRVWRSYLSMLGSLRTALLLGTITVLMHATDQLPRLWLVWWTSDSDPTHTGGYILGYLGMTLGRVFIVGARNFLWFHAANSASRLLHDRMLWSVLRAPMSFFHGTPLGRITSRFSTAVNIVDMELPDLLNDTGMAATALAADIILLAIASPLQLLLIPLFFLALYKTVSMYQASRTELSRLTSIAGSPVQAHLVEMVDGLVTVRALGTSPTETTTMMDHLNTSELCRFYRDTITCWLSVRLMAISGAAVGSIAIAAVLVRSVPALAFVGASPNLLGLALTTVVGINSTLMWMVIQVTNAEGEMSRVERMEHFCATEPEAQLHVTAAVAPAAEWPTAGVVEFCDATLRYRPDQPDVLKQVSFRVEAGERVAIVGRTGAGKSSLMQALFRMVELRSGSIAIDGVDIGSVGLHDLRHRLSIIPQEPVLFTGTVRGNLAPALLSSDGRLATSRPTSPSRSPTDSELWDALERVGMKDYVAAQPLKLDAPVLEAGSNLSVGQRQLLCLARALLRHAKVLVMDEATASVDSESDALIQRTLRESFNGVTILTIAHRLDTVIDYSRVLCMSQGRVVEFDSPSALLRRPDSQFSRMVAQTGDSSARWLRNQAQCSTAPSGGARSGSLAAH